MAVFSLYMGWQMGRISVTILEGKRECIRRICGKQPGCGSSCYNSVLPDDWHGSLATVVERDFPVVSFL